MSETTAPPKRIRKGFLLILVILLLLPVLWVAVGNHLAGRREVAVRRAWADSLGPLGDLLEAFPATSPDAATLELEALARPLGIDLATKGLGRETPTGEAAAAYKAVAPTLRDYLTAVLEDPTPRVPAPPEAVAAFLADHALTLTDLGEHLRAHGPPVWESDLAQGVEAPIPNLLGILQTQRLLTAQALDRARTGDQDAATQILEASWTLNQALRHRPLLITQLIAIAGTRLQVGALRKLDDPPLLWRERLAGLDYGETVQRAFRAEALAWSMLENLESQMWEEGDLFMNLVGSRLARPYLRLCLANTSEIWRQVLVDIQGASLACRNDFSEFDHRLTALLPGWNVLGKLMIPNAFNSLARASRLNFEAELTRKVLELKAARPAGAGAWPAEIPGLEASHCPDVTWDYAVTPAGEMSLASSRTLDWPNQTTFALPTRYTTVNDPETAAPPAS